MGGFKGGRDQIIIIYFQMKYLSAIVALTSAALVADTSAGTQCDPKGWTGTNAELLA